MEKARVTAARKAASSHQQSIVKKLYSKILELMFTNNNPIVVTEDIKRFQHVMGALDCYEKEIVKGSSTDFSAIEEKFQAHKRGVLESDFPFYILLIYRLHIKIEKYNPKGAQSVIISFLDSIEKLKPTDVARTIMKFLSQGDFTLKFNFDDDKVDDCSAFSLFEKAFFVLADVSYDIRPRRSKHGEECLYKSFLYSRMLWVTLAMKFYEVQHLGLSTAPMKEKWKEMLVVFGQSICFDPDTCMELKNGLEVGCLLKLPFQLTCHYQHLGDLFLTEVNQKFRCFDELKDFVKNIYGMISNDNFCTILADIKRKSSSIDEAENINLSGRSENCIESGIKFLDTIYLIYMECNQDVMDSEICHWLSGLVQLVNITGPNSKHYFGLFLDIAESAPLVIKKYRNTLEQYIARAVQKHFFELSIQYIFDLYKSFRILSSKDLCDYLKQYEVPQNMNLRSYQWKYVLREVVVHFRSAHQHSFLKDFFEKMGDKYQKRSEAKKFVMDLINLDIKDLFSMEDKNDKDSHEVRETFAKNLHRYIRRYCHSSCFLPEIEDVFEHISGEVDEFQWLVLNILCPEMIICVKGEHSNFFRKFLNEKIIGFLSFELTWRSGNLSTKQKLCWKILSTYCSEIVISSVNLDWIDHCSDTFQNLRLELVFSKYCEVACTKCIITSALPSEIELHPSKSLLCGYFEFVKRIQIALDDWSEKFRNGTVDEMLLYFRYDAKLHEIGGKFCAPLVETENDLTSFFETFRELNGLLLRVIPGRSDARWCSLLSLLENYGVCLPEEALQLITTKISFPGKPRPSIPGHPNVKWSTFPELLEEYKVHADGYNPGEDSLCSLTLRRDIARKELYNLVEELKSFLKPIMSYLNMLVFFKLTDSALFMTYYKFFHKEFTKSEVTPSCTEKISRKRHSKNVYRLTLPSPNQNSRPDAAQDLSMQTLEKCLEAIDDLIGKIMKGTATYSEIIAKDEQVLEKLDIEKEFGLLSEYADIKRLRSTEGLQGVKSMIEIFQCTALVKNIYLVCNQYKLRAGNDPCLKEVIELTQPYAEKENRYKITSCEAIQNMKRVKEILQIGAKSLKCLGIFEGIKDSEKFHEFVRDRKFYGPQGQALFLQQYGLITAQLRYDEYDERVLNHLRPAFDIITPFADDQKSFTELMTKVTALNTENGLEGLKTVNRNITLIQHWFSRAEGDTLENAVKDLDSIIATGRFYLKEEGNNGVIFLEYDPSSPHNAAGNVEVKKWNNDKIWELVRKLGIVERKEQEEGEKIKGFLHFYQALSKRLEMYRKLRELGEPDYLSKEFLEIECSVNRSDIDDKVDNMQASLTKWKKQVDVFRDKYTWLLYFSMPKALLLYSLISNNKAEDIIQEVSFITPSQPIEPDRIQEALSISEKSMDGQMNICVVGKFLDILFRVPQQQAPVSSHFVQPLYSCQPKFSQVDLLCFIIKIFSGVIPKAYQMLHCHASTTEEELDLFLERVKRRHMEYLMFAVNKLPFKLQERLVQAHFDMKRSGQFSTIHFVETVHSMLHEIPWIKLKEAKDHQLSIVEAEKVCRSVIFESRNFSCIHTVYGIAGSGKTHYVTQQLSGLKSVTIAVNESFSVFGAITKLRSLPLKKKVGLFFNFTILPIESDGDNYSELMNTISWFFFNLFLIGYIEDSNTGLTFCLPRGMDWAVYIEVFSHSGKTAEENLKSFHDGLPILKLLASTHSIDPDTPYAVDNDVQLVCKYLMQYDIRGVNKGINRLYKEGGREIKFSKDLDLTHEKCHELLQKYMPPTNCKVKQQLFIKYMKRRCVFLDNLPGFYLNSGEGEFKESMPGVQITTNTMFLGSTLMEAMLKEVRHFCDSNITSPEQLIYDFKDKGGSFGLIHSNGLNTEEKMKFKEIGIEIPSELKLYSRELLDSYLSRALNVELEDGRLKTIDKSSYVLTLDYTIKMLNIHERFKCGMPVIIEGETGVGKTALIEMLSKLWNESLLLDWKKQQCLLKESLIERIRGIKNPSHFNPVDYNACLQAVQRLSSGEVCRNTLQELCSQSKFSKELKNFLGKIRNHVAVPFLVRNDLEELFDQVEKENTPETTSHLLYAILRAEIQPSFYKINIHAAMTPSDTKSKLDPIFKRANDMLKMYKARLVRIPRNTEEAPMVTVFLDEINTSSCSGLLKEIIVDRSFCGEAIPDNVFIVAACNPHRSNSMASHKEWVRGTYYVRPLHPTLKFLMWDYGSLDEDQETDYTNAKMKMINSTMKGSEVTFFAHLIVKSQSKMREFALEQLKKTRNDLSIEDLNKRSHSCVSQRDIQRVFTFYKWFRDMYTKIKKKNYLNRAVLVALGLVYYLRLNAKFRTEYSEFLDNMTKVQYKLTFSKAFKEELDYYIEQVDLPSGIAKTLALKENLFAIIVCTVTKTPLIIIGDPGSSKTLSFNQVVSNLKGHDSKSKLFRYTDFFPSLDVSYYQCSRHTTSNEIRTVFSRAITRHNCNKEFELPIFCVVFMDEAGLPEERHESLKVLHYYLDEQVVSFVAISNHILDAAKTNRAISLFRPEASCQDLETLARGCLRSSNDQDLEMVVKFCKPYLKCMREREISDFFGLRDFIHFVNYLQRKREDNDIMSQKLVIQGLERNFNGSDKFDEICTKFLQVLKCVNLESNRRSILDVLNESMEDRPQTMKDLTENAVRYKMIIDPSEDGSIVRLLFSFDVLDRENTRVFICSHFPGDGQVQKINTIAAIMYSVTEGHTVVLYQTSDIHESFYTLFNQRFQRIDHPERGTRYYANIALGAYSQPSVVHPNFQCVVVVRQSEINTTPAPFLNRFEKYLLTHGSLLESLLYHLPPCISIVINAAKNKVNEFITLVSGSHSLYGLKPETLDSLILDILPCFSHNYQCLDELGSEDIPDVPEYLTRIILGALRTNAGFHVPKIKMEELVMDTEQIFDLVTCEDFLKRLTRKKAAQAVKDVFKILYTAPGPKKDREQVIALTPEGSMVLSFIQQLLIRLLTKRLMNLMSAEAVVLHRNKIPESYLNNYICHQAHFSLKIAIKIYYDTLQATFSDSSKSPNKIVCFTRLSSLVHKLPVKFPSSNMTKDLEEMVHDLVYEEQETSKLVMHKVSSFQSQSSVHEFLSDFVSSDQAKVCVLLANMQETAQSTINHIRVMIEEVEPKPPDVCRKLFLLLLHFSPAQFFQHCYPVLFLKGWDNCYLDTVAHSTVKGVVDIQHWFFECCFPGVSEPDTLLEALTHLLHQSISGISARICLDDSANIIKTFLNKGVGEILCKKFRAYWKPKLMAQYLEEAATFSMHRESTLNITDSIQTQIKALFEDFCVYMLMQANQSFSLKTLCNEDLSSPVHKLFIDILNDFPVPKLQELKLLTSNSLSIRPPTYCLHFPFFVIIYDLLEKQTADDSLKDIVRSVMSDAKPTVQVLDQRIYLVLNTKLDIWTLYFTDFITHKLNLVGPGLSPVQGRDNLAQQFWDRVYIQLQGYQLSDRLIELHCCVRNSDVVLARMATILYPMMNIQKLQQGSQVVSPTELLQSVEDPEIDHLEHLSLFVINSLFSALTSIFHSAETSGAETPGAETPGAETPGAETPGAETPGAETPGAETPGAETPGAETPGAETPGAETPGAETPGAETKHSKIADWLKFHSDITALPNMKEHIYATEDDACMESMITVMQITATILQSTELDESILSTGEQTFCALFSQYLEKGPAISECCELTSKNRPGLAEVVEIVMGKLFPSVDLVNYIVDRCTLQVRLVVESLLAHFFSPYRLSYATTDVKWFLEFANKHNLWCSIPEEMKEVLMGILTGSSDEDMSSKPAFSNGVVEMSMFKYYLCRILHEDPPDHDDHSEGSSEHSEDSSDNQDSPYRPLGCLKNRALIGEVLMQAKNLGPSGTYVPLFSQTESTETTNLVQNGRMQQPLCHLYFVSVMEKYTVRDLEVHNLVHVAGMIQKVLLEQKNDEEAVLLQLEVQAVIQVLTQRLALLFNPSRLHTVRRIMEQINSMTEGQGKPLALHLMKLLRSSQKFVNLMADEGSHDIKCLQSIPTLPAKNIFCSKSPHHFPFLHSDANEDLSSLYRQVVSTMFNIYNSNKESKDLCNIAHHCKKKSSKSWHDFKMILWLATYYKFYDEKISSPLLCNVIGSPEIGKYLENDYVCLIKSFLQPNLMVGGLESQKGPGDPLYQLFNLHGNQDQSDLDLRHSLANLVAAIVGSPAQSNHLWYHLFSPDKLEKSYITGFMYDATVHCGGLMYDCGVKLSPKGLFGRQDYEKHACRGTYTLHSLYLLLWANFGCFCMSLLTQPGSDKRIHGHIISEKQPSLRQYCVTQLREVWRLMQNNLGLSKEQTSFFIMRAMDKLRNVKISSHATASSTDDVNPMIPDPNQGILKTTMELYNYEKMWHEEIFKSTWDKLPTEFIDFSNESKSILFRTISRLNANYPHFPPEEELIHCILSAGDLQQGGKLCFLSKFAMKWPYLEVGGALLPDLVALYQWLHTDIQHNKFDSAAMTINIIAEEGEDKRKLYDRVKKNYNEYVKLIGVTESGEEKTFCEMVDDTPLLHFLTDVQEGNDCLYNVIEHIITAHNSMINDVYSAIKREGHFFKRFLPEEPSKISITAVSIDQTIVGSTKESLGFISFLDLVHSRYKSTLESLSYEFMIPRCQMSAFQLDQLEEDVVLTFIRSKPIIEMTSNFRKVLQFDLQSMLPNAFKATLSDDSKKHFEREFYSASFHLLSEVVSALRIVIRELIKALQNRSEHYKDLTVTTFIKEIYRLKKDEDSYGVLHKIGVQNASTSQLQCLADLSLTATYNCLTLFMYWVDEGFYDYCNLPFQLKAHLSKTDQQALEQISCKWTGEVLNQIIHRSKCSEQEIIDEVEIDKPICDHLKEDLIPRTIKIHHYMEFRLTLRRLQLRVQHEATEEKDQENQVVRWSEFVSDLWTEHLPHIKPEFYPERQQASTGKFGFLKEREREDGGDST